MSTTCEDFVAGLRRLADWLERNEDAIRTAPPGVRFRDCVGDRNGLVARARVLGGGHWEKATSDIWDTFLLVKRFGPGIEYVIEAPRAGVCERVVVGEREIEEADPDALAALPTIKRTEEIVEWRCPEGLLAEAEPQASAP